MAETIREEPSPNSISPFADQQYALPRPTAGGAHASVNESLTLDLTRGACNLVIPIAVTPARRGWEPKLQLRYDSGAGNGPFGIGWALDLPEIVRQTSRGVPTYGESDVFLLRANGDSVELVPGSLRSDREVNGTTYQVRQFQPQLLKSPFRLEQWRRESDPNDVHWRHISAENVTTMYGVDSSSRIANAEADSIFGWLASYRFDCYGNVINFCYRPEDAVGIDQGDSHQSQNKYVERIQYGNRTPFHRDQVAKSLDFHFEVFFVYSSLSPEEAARSLHENGDPNGAWGCRQDVFSTCRSGFQIRTRRLCRNILMLHHFDNEPSMVFSNGTAAGLVRSFRLDYLEHPRGTQMERFVEAGHCGRKTKNNPAMDFTYNTPELDVHQTIQSINLGSFLSFEQLDWMDMDGTGLPSLVVKNKSGHFIRENISTTSDTPVFTDWMIMADWPALKDAKLSDFDNDGCVEYVDWKWGFYKKRGAKWETFKQFQQVPNHGLKSTHARLMDLTGNGTGDFLVADKQAYLWYQSLREKGFTGPEAAKFADQESTSRPNLQPTQPRESLYIGDMTGDGLLDLVCIRNGSVCYWPNTGHGSFGEQVRMRNSPRFEDDKTFSHARLFLHDLDGSGTADLVYMHSAGGLHVYLNESGNAWTGGSEFARFPRSRHNDVPRLVDLYGNGTMCAVLCDANTGNLHILNLFGPRKARMLATFRNGFGLETKFQYTSSSQLQKMDLLVGSPWNLTLPFPIQCLTQVTTHDSILDVKTERHFSYRDGYYDDVRREFNGFGLVREWNGPKDAFTTLQTTSRYFTGSVDQYAELGMDQQADLIPFILPAGVSGSVSREALRVAKGSLLRQEIAPSASNDGSLIKSEHRRYQIEQYKDGGDKTSFRVTLIQTTTSTFELESTPRIYQYQAIEVDKYGNVLVWVDVHFGLQSAPRPGQASTKILLTERQVTTVLDADDDFRAPVESERRQSGTISGMTHQPNRIFSLSSLKRQAADMTLISLTRQFFRSDDLSQTLTLGRTGLLGLPAYESKLAFDSDDVRNLARGLGTTVQASLKESGYIEGDNGCWYANSGCWFYGYQSGSGLEAAKESFFTPTVHEDQFGNHQIFRYDRYWLCRTRLEMPLGFKTSAEYDYGHMMMSVFIDENGNRWSYEYDGLGNVLRQFEGDRPSPSESTANEQASNLGKDVDLTDIELKSEILLQGATSCSFQDYESQPCKSIHIAKRKHSTSIKISYLSGTGQSCQERSVVNPSKWLVSGSKAMPYIQHDYEPYYDESPHFGRPPPANNLTTTIFDSLHRPAVKIRQDGAWSWIEYGAWSRTEHHFGDTSTLSFPQKLQPALVESSRSLKIAEAGKISMYSNTQRITHLDCQGQEVQLDAHMGHDSTISARKVRSIYGQVEQVYNSKEQCSLLSSYNKLGDVYYTKSVDAGEQYVLRSVDGRTTCLSIGDVRKARFRFDQLRRPTDDLENGEVALSRTYHRDWLLPNSYGRVHVLKNSAVTTTFLGYDVRGNPERIEQQIHLPGYESLNDKLPKFTFQKEYDFDERVFMSRLPNGTQLSYHYDATGRLQDVDDVAKIDYTPAGHLAKISFQNGCETVFKYSNTNWLERKVSTTGSDHIQQCVYERDIMGRIVGISDDAVALFRSEKMPLSWRYAYDGHGRLLSGTTHALPSGETSLVVGSHGDGTSRILSLVQRSEHYTYDSEGNMTSQEIVDPGHSTQLKYQYDGGSNKLQGISKENRPYQTVTYKKSDGALGLPSQVNQLKLRWNPQQRLSSVVDGDTSTEASYLYDTLGMRIAKVTRHLDRTILSVYLEEFESTFVYENGELSKMDEMVLLHTGDTLLGRISSQAGISTIITDHVSSVSLELSQQGHVKSYRSYAPYGEVTLDLRFAEQPLVHVQQDLATEGFTGKKHDIETGFDYSKNRYLATQLKRWLSPDPSGLLGGSNNLYLYADADPVNKLDHDGLCPLYAKDKATGEGYGILQVAATVSHGLALGVFSYYAPAMMGRNFIGRSSNPAVKAFSVLSSAVLMRGLDFSMQQMHAYYNIQYSPAGSALATIAGFRNSVSPLVNIAAATVTSMYDWSQVSTSSATAGYAGLEGLAIRNADPSTVAAMHRKSKFYETTVINNIGSYLAEGGAAQTANYGTNPASGQEIVAAYMNRLDNEGSK